VKRLVNELGVLYDWHRLDEANVIRRLTILAGIVALGLSLGGCSKCGFWWDEAPRGCKGDFPR
jgi:hypothetical protein